MEGIFLKIEEKSRKGIDEQTAFVGEGVLPTKDISSIVNIVTGVDCFLRDFRDGGADTCPLGGPSVI